MIEIILVIYSNPALTPLQKKAETIIFSLQKCRKILNFNVDF